MEENFINNIKYDNYNSNEELTLFLNNISHIIKKFLMSINQIINNLKNVTSTLNKQIISSNYLLKEIKIEQKYSIKFQQLNDRIGMLEDSRKLLKENIKLISYKLNYFSNDIQKKLLLMKEKTIRNNNINTESINVNFDYKGTINSCDDNKNESNKINLMLDNNIDPINTIYKTINNTPLNKLYHQKNTKIKNNDIKSIIINSGLLQDISPNRRTNHFFSTSKNIKSSFTSDNNINSANTSNNNLYKLNIKSKSIKNYNEKDILLNRKKNSRNFYKNNLIKKMHSISNFFTDKSLNSNLDKKNTKIKSNLFLINNNKKNKPNINSYSFRHKNIINNKTIISNNNEINSNTINSINYNNIINNDINNNNEFLLFLSHKVIRFLSLIKEMKNNHNKINNRDDSEFKEIKLKYENLKKTLEDISHKIINSNIYSNNNNNYMNNININNNNNNINELLNEIKIYKNTIFNLETNLSNIKNELYLKEKDNKALSLIKEKLINDNTEKNILISLKTNEIEELKNQNNNYRKYNKNKELIDNLKKEMENYITKIKELKLDLKSKIFEIKKKDKIIENLNINIKKNSLISNDDNYLYPINEFNNLSIENIIYFSYFKDDNSHINNNIYIINELKEKLIKIKEDNLNIKNKYNSLLYENKSLNEQIDILSKNNEKKELLKQEHENEIKKLQLIIKDLNSKINENSLHTEKISGQNEKDDKIELILIENQEIKNQIEELKQNMNNNTCSKNNKNNINKLINDYKSKINFLSEQNNNYLKEIKNLKTEISIIQNEYKSVKSENNILNKKIKEYNIKSENDDYILENYDTICDKTIGKLSWVLLKLKNGNENNYDDYIWIENNNIDNIINFN